MFQTETKFNNEEKNGLLLSRQGGLNKKEIQLNICNIFLFRYLMNFIYLPYNS